jgi:hypothetical protein
VNTQVNLGLSSILRQFTVVKLHLIKLPRYHLPKLHTWVNILQQQTIIFKIYLLSLELAILQTFRKLRKPTVIPYAKPLLMIFYLDVTFSILTVYSISFVDRKSFLIINCSSID